MSIDEGCRFRADSLQWPSSQPVPPQLSENLSKQTFQQGLDQDSASMPTPLTPASVNLEATFLRNSRHFRYFFNKRTVIAHKSYSA